MTTPRPAAGDLGHPGPRPPRSIAFDRAAGLPDEVWLAAAAQVRAELEAGQTDLDTPRPARHTFGFVATRF